MLLSSGTLLAPNGPPSAPDPTVAALSPGGVAMIDAAATYDHLYRSQMWVYAIVNKRANALGRLPAKVYERASSGDRSEIDRAHPLRKLLDQPNPRQTGVALRTWCQSMADIHGEWCLIKVRRGDRVEELWPLHPTKYSVEEGPRGALQVRRNSDRRVFRSEDVILFRRFNPESVLRGLSPLEPLRSTLANEYAARRATESFWRRGARPGFVLQHPAVLSDLARKRLKAQFDETAAGMDNTGGTLVLEEGMTPERLDLSMEEAQYIESRRLNREECCAALDMPPPAVHILDRATFSNITEQMRSLYRDVMAPPIGDYDATINAQLVTPDFGAELYQELLMDEVLRGAFEQRAESIQKLITSGVLTPNEGRRLENLPALPGGDDLLVPLNLRRATDPTPAKASNALPAEVDHDEPAPEPVRPDVRTIAGRLGAVSDPADLDLDRLTSGMTETEAAVTRHVVEDAVATGASMADVRRRLTLLLQPEEDS